MTSWMKTLAREQCKAEILRRLRTCGPTAPAAGDGCRRTRWSAISATLPDGHGREAGQRRRRPCRKTVVKWIALYAAAAVAARHPDAPGDRSARGGTRPVDFAADVAGRGAPRRLMTTRPIGVTWRAHPIFGRMSHAAWLRWGYLHTRITFDSSAPEAAENADTDYTENTEKQLKGNQGIANTRGLCTSLTKLAKVTKVTS